MANAISPLSTPTYDGSGDGMHPGVTRFEKPWHGYSYWMSVTPYPQNNAQFENPSLLASNDGLKWEVPAGVTNPLGTPSGYHLMDPDLFYDSRSDQLWLYYLEAGKDQNVHAWRITSGDGSNWSPKQEIAVAQYPSILSFAIEKTGTGYGMWSVNAFPDGCSAAQTTVEFRSSNDGQNWSSPQGVNLVQPGAHIWHMDVTYVDVKKEYWAVYAAYSQQSCGTTDLYFARSADGLNWTTYPHPLLHGSQGWDGAQIYRSTTSYESTTDMLRLWYSARDSNHDWHTGYTEMHYAELLRALQR
jgi:hypothetical protein